MGWKYFWLILKIFFGVCLILTSIGILLFNAVFLETGFDAALGLLDLFVFLCGLFLLVFAAAKLPSDRGEEEKA